MPLPAIGTAAARAGAAASRTGVKVKQIAGGVARKTKKPTTPSSVVSGMPIPQFRLDRLFSIEGIMMLITAGIIDILGLIDAIPIVGTFLSYVFDIVGILLIGGWIMFAKSGGGSIPIVGGRGGKLGKWSVRLFCIGGELIPVIGALPLWTVLVFFELILD